MVRGLKDEELTIKLEKKIQTDVIKVRTYFPQYRSLWNNRPDRRFTGNSHVKNSISIFHIVPEILRKQINLNKNLAPCTSKTVF